MEGCVYLVMTSWVGDWSLLVAVLNRLDQQDGVLCAESRPEVPMDQPVHGR